MILIDVSLIDFWMLGYRLVLWLVRGFVGFELLG